MTPESPQTPREELEARLTALLLDELSAEEAAALRQAIEQDAELRQLHERLKQTIGLVREATGAVNDETVAQTPALKLSAAFGGVTAALVIEPSAKRPAIDPVPSMAQDRAINGTTPARSLRAVAVLSHAGIDAFERPALAASLGMPLDRLARIDDLGQLALAAVVALRERAGNDAFAGAGIVGGYALATLDTNERFYSRLLEKGPRLVDPRLFPATSPNAGAGHVAIAFGLTGPSFAMCGGLGGAIVGLLAAAELIAAGDAERMIVVAADDDGPAARDWLELCAPGRRHARGATAVLLGVAPAGAAELVDLDRAVDHDGPAVGHLALRDWLAGPAR